jgi:Tol biopolymer transport system component
MKNKGWLTTGLVVGLIAGSCASAFAADGIQYIKASINDTFKFEVNGEAKALDDEYELLVYNNRSYLPVRGIGEMLGADIDWDDASKTIKIDTSKLSNNNTENDSNSSTAEKTEYKTLPQIYENLDFRVTATGFYSDDVKGDTVYLQIKNKEDKVLRLVSAKTTYTINDKTYTTNDVDSVFWDTRWYTQYVEKDKELEGYLRLPIDLDEYDNMTVHIELQYDGESSTQSVDFNIAV